MDGAETRFIETSSMNIIFLGLSVSIIVNIYADIDVENDVLICVFECRKILCMERMMGTILTSEVMRGVCGLPFLLN